MGNDDDILAFHACLHERYAARHFNPAGSIAPELHQFAGVTAASTTISFDHHTVDHAPNRVRCQLFSVFHRDSVLCITFGSLASEVESQLDPFKVLASEFRLT
jgi:hypothetical protein